MKVGGIEKTGAHYEPDESFIGRLAKNMHEHKRERAIKGTGGAGKSVVMGIIRRKSKKSSSKVRARHVCDTSAASLQGVVRENVRRGANLYTDAFSAYQGLAPAFNHQVVDHAVEYVRGAIHTNACENYFNLLKPND